MESLRFRDLRSADIHAHSRARARCRARLGDRSRCGYLRSRLGGGTDDQPTTTTDARTDAGRVDESEEVEP